VVWCQLGYIHRAGCWAGSAAWVLACQIVRWIPSVTVYAGWYPSTRRALADENTEPRPCPCVVPD